MDLELGNHRTATFVKMCSWTTSAFLAWVTAFGHNGTDGVQARVG